MFSPLRQLQPCFLHTRRRWPVFHQTASEPAHKHSVEACNTPVEQKTGTRWLMLDIHRPVNDEDHTRAKLNTSKQGKNSDPPFSTLDILSFVTLEKMQENKMKWNWEAAIYKSGGIPKQ